MAVQEGNGLSELQVLRQPINMEVFGLKLSQANRFDFTRDCCDSMLRSRCQKAVKCC